MPPGRVPRLRRTGRRADPWPVLPAGLELIVLGAVLLAVALLALLAPLRASFDAKGLALLAVAGALLVGTGAAVRRRSA